MIEECIDPFEVSFALTLTQTKEKRAFHATDDSMNDDISSQDRQIFELLSIFYVLPIIRILLLRGYI